MSLSMTFNDYGIHILSEEDPNWTEQDWRRFLDPQNLRKDLEQAIHTVEMDRRQFRDIARIARNPCYVTELAAIHFDSMDGLL